MILEVFPFLLWTEQRGTKSSSVWFSWENWFSFDSVNGVTTGTVNPISKMWFSIRTTTSSRPIARTRGNGTHLTSIQRIWANHIETWVRFPSPAPPSFQLTKTVSISGFGSGNWSTLLPKLTTFPLLFMVVRYVTLAAIPGINVRHLVHLGCPAHSQLFEIMSNNVNIQVFISSSGLRTGWLRYSRFAIL